MGHLQSLSTVQLKLRRRELQDEIDDGEITPITAKDFLRQVMAIDAELASRDVHPQR